MRQQQQQQQHQRQQQYSQNAVVVVAVFGCKGAHTYTVCTMRWDVSMVFGLVIPFCGFFWSVFVFLLYIPWPLVNGFYALLLLYTHGIQHWAVMLMGYICWQVDWWFRKSFWQYIYYSTHCVWEVCFSYSHYSSRKEMKMCALALATRSLAIVYNENAIKRIRWTHNITQHEHVAMLKLLKVFR